ncbi:MAG: alginate export family protein [Vicinamibacterales bacterium]
MCSVPVTAADRSQESAAAKPRTFMAWKHKAAATPEKPAKKPAAAPATKAVTVTAALKPAARKTRPPRAAVAPTVTRVRVEWTTAPVRQVPPGYVAVEWESAAATPPPAPAAAMAAEAPAPAADGIVLPSQPAVPGAPAVAAAQPAPRPAPPKTVQVAVNYRGRVEGADGYAAVRATDDHYYLNRVRLDVSVAATPWLRGFAQVQDAEVVGYDLAPAPPATHVNRFDVRQGYVEIGRPGKAGVLARLGRQEFVFGEQRLMGGGDWNNTARAFDAARVSLFRPGVKVDAFVATVVTVVPLDLDGRRTDEFVYGGYAAFDRMVPKGVVEPYVFVKESDAVVSEAGVAGAGRVLTIGARAAGRILGGFDYSLEHAWQRGTLSTDTVDALAGAYRLGWTAAGWPMTPRFVGEFNHATGDGVAGDGRRQTFDQLYPTNHAKYGIVDVMGWRNMRDLMAGLEFTPVRRVKVNADLHRLMLATTQDGMYVDSGARRLLNRNALSRDVGVEFDVQSTVTITPQFGLSAGFGYLATGDYLTEATGGGGVWFPYVMWNVRF